ncbi:MAG: Gfo/Idh/MocA family oxidoreductase [Flavitalea sp.]
MLYRFAIIGCGNIGVRHAEHIAATGLLAAVCDIDPQRAADIGSGSAAKLYSDAYKMLITEKPDVVVVCTPNGLHAEHTIMALNAGCHVLCEKPMAISVADANRMIDAATQNRRRLFVVKQNRYNPPVTAVKSLLDQKKLGKIHAFQLNCFWNRPASYYKNSWRGTIAMDGGILFTQFSHFIDLLYWWLGEIETVKGFRSIALHNGIIEFEDNGVASLVMKSGAIGCLQYSINAYHENFEGSVTLFGEKGTVKIGGQYLNNIEHFKVDGEDMPQLAPSADSNKYGFYKGSMSNHHIVYEQLLMALKDPAHVIPEGDDGLKCIQMIRQIYDGSPFIETKNP